MSRIVNLLFALILLGALVIALDPQSRRKAVETVRRWEPALKQLDNKIVVNAPAPTAMAVADEEEQQIPVTGGDEDAANKPIIQVNWDALKQELRQFWTSLMNIKIDLNPNDNK